MVKLIWAEDKNKGIGNKGDLLWHIPEDLKFFKTVTEGSSIIMGRKTFDSLPIKPLPKRDNIVLSRKPLDSFPNVKTVTNVQEVLDKYNDSWVIGGGMVYELFLPYATEAYITEVDYCAPQVDTFAPSVELVNRYLYLEKQGSWNTSIKGLKFRINHHMKL